MMPLLSSDFVRRNIQPTSVLNCFDFTNLVSLKYRLLQHRQPN